MVYQVCGIQQVPILGPFFLVIYANDLADNLAKGLPFHADYVEIIPPTSKSWK